MIKSGEDIRYAQDVFGCFPVADIVERRTVKFLKKYKEANDNNIVCIRYWLSSYQCYWLVVFLFLFYFFFILFIVYHLWWNKDVYTKLAGRPKIRRLADLKLKGLTEFDPGGGLRFPSALFLVFIARQRAMFFCYQFCPSVRCRYRVCTYEHIVALFMTW